MLSSLFSTVKPPPSIFEELCLYSTKSWSLLDYSSLTWLISERILSSAALLGGYVYTRPWVHPQRRRLRQLLLQIPVGIQILWGLIIIVSMYMLPESPRHLLYVNKIPEARAAIANLNSTSPESPLVDDIINELTLGLQEENAGGKATWMECFSPVLRHRTINGVSTHTSLKMLFHNWSILLFASDDASIPSTAEWSSECHDDWWRWLELKIFLVDLRTFIITTETPSSNLLDPSESLLRIPCAFGSFWTTLGYPPTSFKSFLEESLSRWSSLLSTWLKLKDVVKLYWVSLASIWTFERQRLLTSYFSTTSRSSRRSSLRSHCCIGRTLHFGSEWYSQRRSDTHKQEGRTSKLVLETSEP